MNALTADPITLAYHELRAPLGLVATATRALAEDSADDEVRARCRVILRAVERMLRTTGQVFTVARAAESDAGEWFCPADLLSQLCDDLRAFDVPLEMQADPFTSTVRVFGPRQVFEALVHALLSNAADHVEPGATISVRARAESGALVLTIANRIARQGRHHGLGVGMYLSGRLAEQLGANLQTEVSGGQFQAVLQLPSSRRDYDTSM